MSEYKINLIQYLLLLLLLRIDRGYGLSGTSTFRGRGELCDFRCGVRFAGLSELRELCLNGFKFYLVMRGESGLQKAGVLSPPVITLIFSFKKLMVSVFCVEFSRLWFVLILYYSKRVTSAFEFRAIYDLGKFTTFLFTLKGEFFMVIVAAAVVSIVSL